MTRFNVPFVQTNDGSVALQEGNHVTISAPGTKNIAFGIYQPFDGKTPVLIGQSKLNDDHVTFVLKRQGVSLLGKATLKITAVNQNNTQSSFEKVFTIIP